MKLIVGLGNPGKQYEKTRHNVGFFVIDELCQKLNVELNKKKCKAIYGTYMHNGEKIILAKPQTYMNLSGEAVQSLMHFYQIAADDVIVIHDDLDLPVGKLRLRMKGSSGGQKGMGNIITHLHSSDIDRIRIGIGNNKLIDTKDYVLSSFHGEELVAIKEAVRKAADAVIYSFDHRFDEVMSVFNQ
ncbi:MAG: aminoacyl-tRNA hydrolase [Erysipelotrichaceae bacterium]|nr:aminoacyl-tRNA hydrolase [Erysipelotrichaceae bacterium]